MHGHMKFNSRKRVSIFGTGNRLRRYLGLFLGSKSPGHEADPSSPSRLQIKNEWIFASTPHVFMKSKGRTYSLFACVLEKPMWDFSPYYAWLLRCSLLSIFMILLFSRSRSITVLNPKSLSPTVWLTAPPKKVTITAKVLKFSLTADTPVLTHCRFPKLWCAFNLLFPKGRPDIAQEPSEQ